MIVYVEPRVISQPLAAFLAHNLVKAGGYQYLHVAVDMRAGTRRLVSILAHELQRALEVPRIPAARMKLESSVCMREWP